MNKLLRYGSVFLLFVAFIFIRFFERDLFYDVFMDFYKGNYYQKPIPDIPFYSTLFTLALRYLTNTLISLLVLYLFFLKKSVIKFALFLYGFVFLILMAAFAFLINDFQPDYYFATFYVRRFLIQPLLIILLLPAFYYQHKIKK